MSILNIDSIISGCFGNEPALLPRGGPRLRGGLHDSKNMGTWQVNYCILLLLPSFFQQVFWKYTPQTFQDIENRFQCKGRDVLETTRAEYGSEGKGCCPVLSRPKRFPSPFQPPVIETFSTRVFMGNHKLQFVVSRCPDLARRSLFIPPCRC